MKRSFLAVTHRPDAGNVPHRFDFILKKRFCWLQIFNPVFFFSSRGHFCSLSLAIVAKPVCHHEGMVNPLGWHRHPGCCTFRVFHFQQSSAAEINNSRKRAASTDLSHGSTYMHRHNDRILQNISSQNNVVSRRRTVT